MPNYKISTHLIFYELNFYKLTDYLTLTKRTAGRFWCQKLELFPMGIGSSHSVWCLSRPKIEKVTPLKSCFSLW